MGRDFVELSMVDGFLGPTLCSLADGATVFLGRIFTGVPDHDPCVGQLRG